MKSTSHGTSMWRMRSRQEEDRALEHADQQQARALRSPRRSRAPSSRTRARSSSGWTRISPIGGVAHPWRGSLSAVARGRRRRPLACAASPPDDHRADALAHVQRAVAQRQELRRDGPARGGHRRRAASSASRRTTSRASAGGSVARCSVPTWSRPSSTVATSSSSTSASSRSSSAVRSTLRSAAGCSARSAGTRPSRARARARTRATSLRRVLAPRQPARRGSTPRSPRAYAEQRPHEQPVARRHPEQRAPPRRRREPVEDRLGLVGRGVARSRPRAARGREPRRRAVAERRGPRPAGCPRARRRPGRARRRARRRARAHSARAVRLVAVGRLAAQAVVDVQRDDRVAAGERAATSSRQTESRPPQSSTTTGAPAREQAGGADALAAGRSWSPPARLGQEQLGRLREALEPHLADAARTPGRGRPPRRPRRVTSTSPPAARAATRAARFTSRP